ncbi:MAG: hypothetical protein J0H34_10590 [Rhizobiales bacterium]|nr:hypothetical protein [Hyphomicrobiales bacterium]
MPDRPFRVALSGDFRKPDGSPTYPDFDLTPLGTTPGLEMDYLEQRNPLTADQLEDFDALILLTHRFDAGSVPKSGRLSVVARFGVGYDTVDVKACTDAGIALVITPDGVRRPVAVSVITLMLALTRVLQERRIAGAGLDVLEHEPPDADDPILKLDNVILAPHALCWTDQCFAGNGAADVKAVLEVMRGREPRGVVNRDVLETPVWKKRLAGYAARFGS